MRSRRSRRGCARCWPSTRSCPGRSWLSASAGRDRSHGSASRCARCGSPPGTGKTHLAIALGVTAARHGHRVLFATATDWVTRLHDAHLVGRLAPELARLRRYGLIIIDEVGYLPFEAEAANLFFQLVSTRYEHASLILTSNLPFSAWGTVFGDQAVAAAMIDRIVHHADVLTLTGASYRLKNLRIDTLPSARAEQAH